jgi:hypothetical protein
MASATSKWQTAVSRSLSNDPNAGGSSKGLDMWAAAIAQGAAEAAGATEAHVTHRPGAPGVVCGTLNLLGEGFNPFEFIATGDKAFMGKQHSTQFQYFAAHCILLLPLPPVSLHARAFSCHLS